MEFNYVPRGVCSRKITFDLSENGTLSNVSFLGGCNGNLQGISRLVEGMKADEAIKKLENINCGGKGTSCPDQLAKALKDAISKC